MSERSSATYVRLDAAAWGTHRGDLGGCLLLVAMERDEVMWSKYDRQ